MVQQSFWMAYVWLVNRLEIHSLDVPWIAWRSTLMTKLVVTGCWDSTLKIYDVDNKTRKAVSYLTLWIRYVASVKCPNWGQISAVYQIL